MNKIHSIQTISKSMSLIGTPSTLYNYSEDNHYVPKIQL